MKNRTLKPTIIALMLILLSLTACYEFDFVNQPSSADLNSSFDVEISITINSYTDSSAAYFGVLLPEGWWMNDIISYYLNPNVLSAIEYSDELSIQMTSTDPPPENYYWWVGYDEKIEAEPDDNIELDVTIYTDDQTGTFFLDYMLGDSGKNYGWGTTGLNFKRSNNHLIIVGEPVGCIPEGIVFTSQAEIDSFQINYPNCFETAGNITISGNNITSLSGLENLTTIGGNLNITACDSLTDFWGLSNLTSIGGALSIIGNNTLNSLTGLESLTFIGRDLWVENNTMLTGLTALENLTHIGETVAIISNAAFTDLQGLENITALGGCLRVENNGLLISLSGLENLDTLASGLIIGGNNNLTGINELMDIAVLGWDLSIESNFNLNSLSGLDNIQSIGGQLRITNNDSLHELNGLEALIFIGDDLRITNSALANLSGLDNLTTIGGELRLGNNYLLTSLEGLENLTSIGKNLIFGWGHGTLGNSSHALESLEGLSNLTSIGGNLHVSECGSLINLSGLENLNTIQGGLFIGPSEYGNPNLVSLTGLENLELVGDYMDISSNNSLITISSLQGLTSVGGSLRISGNDILPSLSGLENIVSVGGGLTISNNSVMINLAGIEGLMSINGGLEIDRNDSMINLNGLENLTSIDGNIIIGGNASYEGNPSLTSLSGIENINAGTIDSLHIQKNPSLSSCEVQSICDYLAAPNGTIIIMENAPGCDSPEEVEDACDPGTSLGGLIAEETFSISPNPVSGATHLKLVISDREIVISEIVSISGMKVRELVNEELAPGVHSLKIDLSDLQAGIYFCVLKIKDGTHTKKIIKL